MTRGLFLTLFSFTLVIQSALSTAAESADPALLEEAELLELLAEQTEIATRSRLNSDYVPGMVTILRGDDLAQRGARTVWDALSFVPGVAPAITSTGLPRITVRGIGAVGPYRSEGYVKVLQNGIPLNDDATGLADAALLLPLAQVERIEVIRGPGSALYGEYAMAGVVNIITRSDEAQAFLFGGSEQTLGGGAIVSTGNEHFQLSLNLSQWRSEGADMTVKSDVIYSVGMDDIAQSSYAPGPANEGIQGRYGVVQLTAGGFSWVGQWHEMRLGDYFGINNALPPPTDRAVNVSRIASFEARQRLESRYGRLEFYVGERRYRLKKEDQFVGTTMAFFGVAGADLVNSIDYEERRRYSGVDGLAERGQHRLLLSLQQADIRTLQDQQRFDFRPSSEAFAAFGSLLNSATYPIPEGTTRHTASATLQDEYRVSDAFSVTYGLRYDRYSDVDDHWSPRLAAVWRWDDRQTVKAQYSRAYRPPTFYELAFHPNGLPAVTMETLELGYLAGRPHGHWGLSAAYSKVGHRLMLNMMNEFARGELAEIWSLELEWEHLLGPDLSMTGSLARLWSEQEGSSGAIPGSSDWLARLGVQWRAAAGLFASLDSNSVSNFYREQADPRPAADGFTTLDLTLTQETRRGLTLRAGITNLLDADVRIPSTLNPDDGDSGLVSYIDDLPRAGRTWWIELSQAF